MSLKTEMYKILDNVCRLCREVPEAEEIVETLTELRDRLNKPLRVAVVGMVKAGKSTFMNALMQTNIAFTGTDETTYTVSWFRYGDIPSLTVCFRNGEELKADITEIEKWSVRNRRDINPRIDDVAYLIIDYPSEVLKTIEFIDTPGLGSVYGTDAQNTMDFLALRGSEETLYEAGKADAVIFAFKRTLQESDRKTLLQFQGNEKSNTSPINSLGIFTRLDEGGDWDVDEDMVSPVEKAKKRTDKMRNRIEVKQMLFSILPICAKPAEGFEQLEFCDWEVLDGIAQKDRKDLQEALGMAEEFQNSVEEEYMEFGTAAERKRLLDRLAPYGILEITDQIRKGKTQEEIREILQEVCGIESVRSLINQHFGNRTFLIKSQYIINRLNSIWHKILYHSDSSQELKQIGNYIRDEVGRLLSSVHTLKELKVLQMYYNNQIPTMSEGEKEDLLRITGEYGRLPEMRLDAPKGSSIMELAAVARKKAGLWNGKANGFMIPGAYQEAAFIIAHSYELMYYHLNALIEE